MRRRWSRSSGSVWSCVTLTGAPAPAPALIDVTVHEGTSMSVGDLARRPHARHRPAGQHLDACRRPAARRRASPTSSTTRASRRGRPTASAIAFFAYRDGGYDIWAIAPDGSNQHKLTWGPFDDREPVWSHDGTRIAFSSDRGNPLGSDYNIWMLDIAQRRAEAADQGRQPRTSCRRWSPDDSEIAFASAREN